MPDLARPRVLVTRAAGKGSALAAHLSALGADPVLIPAIEFAPPSSGAAFAAALAHLGQFHWLLFTSATAVEAFASALGREGPSAAGAQALLHSPGRPRLAVIGAATARALTPLGLAPDLIPSQAVAESLTAALLPHARQPDGSPTRFLLPRAEEARELLPETLRAAGAEVTVAPAYRTVIPPGSVTRLRDLLSASAQPLAAITFTSASTARNLVALSEAANVTLPATALRCSIGPVTSQALRDLGLPPDAEAPEATVAALAETLWNALVAQKGNPTC